MPDPEFEHVCDDGWVWVTASYAMARATADEGSHAALMNTVYPCKHCRPAQFYRWAHGCYGVDHDAFNCPECQAAGTSGRRRARGPLRSVPDITRSAHAREMDDE